MGLFRIAPALLYVAGILWPPVCTAIVVSRFAVRRALKTSLGWDDWLTIPALILVIGMAATVLASVATHALGYPTPKRPAPHRLSSQELQARKSYYSMVVLQVTALACIKLSCLLFYKRIFRNTHRAYMIVIDVLSVLIVIWGIGFTFSWTFGCGTHWSRLWDAASSLSCPASFVKINLALSFSDTIMDLIVLLLPIPMISHWSLIVPDAAAAAHQDQALQLHMSTSRRLALVVIFALGAAAIAASIMRVVIICLTLNLQFVTNTDQDLISTAGIYAIYIEACFALCAICLPSLAGASQLSAIRQHLDRANGCASDLVRTFKSSESSSRSESLRGLDGSLAGTAPEQANNRKRPSDESVSVPSIASSAKTMTQPETE